LIHTASLPCGEFIRGFTVFPHRPFLAAGRHQLPLILSAGDDTTLILGKNIIAVFFQTSSGEDKTTHHTGNQYVIDFTNEVFWKWPEEII
jgi:hypothetical protein